MKGLKCVFCKSEVLAQDYATCEIEGKKKPCHIECWKENQEVLKK